MTVIIQNGEYKGCLAQVFYKGGEAYFRDELIESDVLLKNYEYIDAEKETVEMTLEEVCQTLGKNIKIVN